MEAPTNPSVIVLTETLLGHMLENGFGDYCLRLTARYAKHLSDFMEREGLRDYNPTHSHVLPGPIRRFHEAKLARATYVTCWGDGSARREFLYVDDLAEFCVLYIFDEPLSNGFPGKCNAFLALRICGFLNSFLNNNKK